MPSSRRVVRIWPTLASTASTWARGGITAGAVALFLRDESWQVDRGVRDVGEEWLVLVAFDEVDGRIGDGVDEHCLAWCVGDVGDGFFSLHVG